MIVKQEDGGKVLQAVLPEAMRLTLVEIAECEGQGTLTRSGVRDAWVRGLRKAFASFYEAQTAPPHVAVFGGKPRPGDCQVARVSSGIPQWRRWEFLHDVAVVEWDYLPAAYARDVSDPLMARQIPIVTRAIWQIESEIAGDGTKVAEDASKLRVGTAENKLLVASFTGQRDQLPWLHFLRDTLSGTSGNLYLGLPPGKWRALR